MSFKIYYINLEGRKDRNINMINLLKNFEKYNIDYERIDAINGKNINLEELIETGILYKDYNNVYPGLKRGQIGCILSHIKAWKTFLNSEEEFGIFFEDDIEVNKAYFDEIMPKLITDLPSINFTICFLSQNICVSKIEERNYFGESINEYLYRVYGHGYGGHSYILNKKSAEILIKYYQKNKIMRPLDIYHIVVIEIKRILNYNCLLMCVKPLFLYYNFTIEYFKKTYSPRTIGQEFLFYQKDTSDTDTFRIK